MCGVCVLVAVGCSVPVVCAVAVRCGCCCGSVVVVGARGGAGVVVGSFPLPREVVGVVATAGAAATQTVGSLEEDEDDVSAIAVVASMAETCLVEDVSAENVEDPVAKAQACC